MGSRWIGAAVALLMSAALAMADDKPQATQPAPKMSKETRFMLIRGINAERVFVRRTFPMGEKGLTLKNGVVTPDENQAKFIAAQYGPAARPGERAQITDVIVKDKSIIFEINGGPKKKKKWYQRIEVGGMGGSTPIAPDGSPQNPKGSFVVLVFDKYVPELSPQEVKDLLAPVFDFTALSATQAYIDSLPPKTRDALKNGRILVGMDREMVTVAKGRPDKKIRERDEAGKDFEEWMYGVPPKDVEFIRFVGNEVIQVKIMKVDGQKIVRTEREVDLPQTAAAQPGPVAEEAAPAPRPANAPTLRRPGEAPEDPVGTSNPSRVGIPPDTRPAPVPETQPQPQPE